MGDTVHRVALVSPAWPPGSVANGIITYVQHLRAGLRECGVECRVAAYARSPGGEDAELVGGAVSGSSRLARLATRVGRRLLPRATAQAAAALDAMRCVRRLERGWPFDLLETEETFGRARWITRAVTAPVVVRLHGPWVIHGPVFGVPQDATFRARVRAEGRAIANAAAVSSPSRDVLRRVREYYRLPLPDAAVLPCPGPEPNPAHTWERAAAEPGHVLFVGRFDRHKGGDIAIDAFARLADRLPSLRLTMAGPDNGVVDDSGRRWSFPEYVADKVPAPHRGRIEFVGQVSPDALVRLRQRAGVVISASRYENFALAVLEAMAQGCPVVCPDAGGLPEMVEDGLSGLVYPAGDATALADRIASLITSPDRAAELGERALERYRAHYTPKQVALQTLEFYHDVCRRNRAHARGVRL